MNDSPDDGLRLRVDCGNQALPIDARAALCSSEAKAAIGGAVIPSDAPQEWPGKACDGVYRIYNAGRSAPQGPSRERATLLRAEALRLARRLVQSEPRPEAQGLLALMLLHESRGSSSVDPVTDLAMLKRQDRSSWSRQHIVEARGLIDRAFGSPHVGSFVLRAAIAAVHAEAATFAATDWARIVALHDFLAHADASAVVASSRALAIGMASAKS